MILDFQKRYFLNTFFKWTAKIGKLKRENEGMKEVFS